MAIVYLDNGEERYIDDALLAALDYEPLRKRQLRDRIRLLRDQLTNFPAQTNAELVAWAELNNPQERERNRIRADIDILQEELQAWL